MESGEFMDIKTEDDEEDPLADVGEITMNFGNPVQLGTQESSLSSHESLNKRLTFYHKKQ